MYPDIISKLDNVFRTIKSITIPPGMINPKEKLVIEKPDSKYEKILNLILDKLDYHISSISITIAIKKSISFIKLINSIKKCVVLD